MHYAPGRFDHLFSRETAWNPLWSPRALPKHLCGFMFLRQVKKGRQRRCLRESCDGLPLRDEEHLTMRGVALKRLEPHGTIRGAKIDADAEFRVRHRRLN